MAEPATSRRILGGIAANLRALAAPTAERKTIEVGNEVRFLRPEQARPALTNTDSHYDVMHVEDGMVAVKRTLYRARGEMRSAWHWAPLTAVERVDVKGHRCTGGIPRPARHLDGA